VCVWGVALCIPWDMAHSYLRHDSFICETWLILPCGIWLVHTRCMYEASLLVHVRHDSFIFETRPIYAWDMTHLHVRHDLFICATWLILPRVIWLVYTGCMYEASLRWYDKTWLIYVWRHNSFMCERHDSYKTWLIYMWRRNSFMCHDTTWTHETWLICMWTHMS